MNIEKAKQIPIEMVLQKMNYTPSKTYGFDTWYSSPLHCKSSAKSGLIQFKTKRVFSKIINFEIV